MRARIYMHVPGATNGKSAEPRRSVAAGGVIGADCVVAAFALVSWASNCVAAWCSTAKSCAWRADGMRMKACSGGREQWGLVRGRGREGSGRQVARSEGVVEEAMASNLSERAERAVRWAWA